MKDKVDPYMQPLYDALNDFLPAKQLAKLIEEKTIEIAGRKIAIEYAVKNLEQDDILLIAGKGHEKYQIIADQKFEFDEEQIVMDAIHLI